MTMKKTDGSIQMTILIAFIIGAVVVGGIGYVEIRQYKSSQMEKTQQAPKQAPSESDQTTTTQELSEIEKLKKEIEELKNPQPPPTSTHAQKNIDVIPTCTISVSPKTISKGELAVLTWSIKGAEYKAHDIAVVMSKEVDGKLSPDGDFSWTSSEIKSYDSRSVAPLVKTHYDLKTSTSDGKPNIHCSAILNVISQGGTAVANSAENFWKSLVEGYASDAEWFRRNIEEIKNGQEIPDMKSRKVKITKLLGDIRNTPFLNFSEGATFNVALDLYGDVVEDEITNIDKRLLAIESNLAAMENYRVGFNKKVDSLLADPNKFRTREDYSSYLKEEANFVDKRFENYQNIISIFSVHYQGVADKVDQIMKISAVLQTEITKLSELTTVKAPPSQPIPSSPPPSLPQIPTTTYCTLVPGPSGGFAYATVRCN